MVDTGTAEYVTCICCIPNLFDLFDADHRDGAKGKGAENAFCDIRCNSCDSRKGQPDRAVHTEHRDTMFGHFFHLTEIQNLQDIEKLTGSYEQNAQALRQGHRCRWQQQNYSTVAFHEWRHKRSLR